MQTVVSTSSSLNNLLHMFSWALTSLFCRTLQSKEVKRDIKEGNNRDIEKKNWEMAGQEVLFCSVIDQLQSPQDSLVIVLHWNLISNGFKCCGIGDEVDFKKIYHYIIFTFYFLFVHKDLLPSYYFQCTINVQHI